MSEGSYQQLVALERATLYGLKEAGLSIVEISKRLSRHRSTVRERQSRFIFGLLNPSKEAPSTAGAIISHFEAQKPGLITTVTLDNYGGGIR
jgi:IS30 family transposase